MTVDSIHRYDCLDTNYLDQSTLCRMGYHVFETSLIDEFETTHTRNSHRDFESILSVHRNNQIDSSSWLFPNRAKIMFSREKVKKLFS